MTRIVVVTSRPPEGGLVRLAIAASGNGLGTIAASTWRPKDAETGPPHKTDTYAIYDARRNAAADSVACRASVFGPDPVVICRLVAAVPPGRPAVAITIKGTLGGFADGSNSYPVDEADFDRLKTFVAEADFGEG